MVKVAYNVEADVVALGKLMTRHADVPMSLADACLVRMIERQPDATVLTLDRDFRVYRSRTPGHPRPHAVGYLSALEIEMKRT